MADKSGTNDPIYFAPNYPYKSLNFVSSLEENAWLL